MNGLSKDQIILLDYLLNAKEPLTSDVLAVAMGTTSKTIRNRIQVIAEILELTGGAHLLSKTGLGYYLEIFDVNEFGVFTQTFNFKYRGNDVISDSSESRVVYMISRLLFLENGYVKIDQLAEELYVSRTTISTELWKVKNKLTDYHLTLEQRSNYGIRLAGRESHIRVALSEFMNADEDVISIASKVSKSIYGKDPQMIQDIVTQNMLDYNISISNNSIQKLVKLIIASDYRIKKGLEIEYTKKDIEELKCKVEWHVAENIIKILGFAEWSEQEITYIAIFIISRRNITNKDIYDIRKERRYFEMSGRIIDWIFETTEVDMTVYPKLRQELARHLRGMYYRILYGLEKRGVGVMESRGSNPAFEYAVISSQYIERQLHAKVQEKEIVYLSYRFYEHFSSMSNHKKMTILVVLENGINTSDLFIYELKNSFGKYIERVEVVEFYQMPYVAFDNFDCILTDIPEVRFSVNIPVKRVNFIFNETDMERLSSFFTKSPMNLQKFYNCFHEELFIRQMEGKSKHEIILELTCKIKEHYNIAADVYDKISEREKMASAEQRNGVAIAHTLYARAKEPIIAIGVLKKPIIWDNEKCQIVFVVVNGIDEYEPFLALGLLKSAAKNIRFVYNLVKADSFSQVAEYLKEFVDNYS